MEHPDSDILRKSSRDDFQLRGLHDLSDSGPMEAAPAFSIGGGNKSLGGEFEPTAPDFCVICGIGTKFVSNHDDRVL